MTWTPITRDELGELIRRGQDAMGPELLRLWRAIMIDPVKWQEAGYGAEGGGFWVVAIIGKQVLWYNDIEDGFNVSGYSEHGRIGQYFCNRSALQWEVKYLYDQLVGEVDATRFLTGPPQPLDR